MEIERGREREKGVTVRRMGTLLPSLGMLVAILAQVGDMVARKAAMSEGTNKYVMIVCSKALSSLILLPCSYIFHRSDRPTLTFSTLCRVFCLSLIGCAAELCNYIGIDYSSPALGTAMLNLVPALTFMLAIIFRMETLDWRSTSSRAKSLGALVSISGAFVVTFYKGPTIMITSESSLLNVPSSLPLLLSTQINWVLGGMFLAVEAFLCPAWFIVQASILKKFPAVLIIMFYYSLFATILAALFSLIAIRDQSAWRLKLDIGLVAILYSAVVGYAFRLSLITWCLWKTGPFFVSMFKPLAIIFAVAMDFILLGDSLSLGSVIGAVIMVSGFYAVMWGKAQERKIEDDYALPSSEGVPLLQNRTEET